MPPPRPKRAFPDPGQRGQNLVEFVLVAPILLVLILGIMEGGLFVNARITLDNAAREGARVAAVCGSSKVYRDANGATQVGTNACASAASVAITNHLGILDTANWTTPPSISCDPHPASACPHFLAGDLSTPAGSTVEVDL